MKNQVINDVATPVWNKQESPQKNFPNTLKVPTASLHHKEHDPTFGNIKMKSEVP